MNTILVTGASGFIGRFLILALLHKGEHVYALMRDPDRQFPDLARWLAAHGVRDLSRLQPIHGDLAQPDLAISAADWQTMQAVSVVYHSGAAMIWGMDMAQARQTNLHGSTQLLTLAQQHLTLRRFVQVSGFLVMLPHYLQRLGIGADGRDVDWPAVYAQVGAYEASKLDTHFAITHLAARLGVPLTVIHPALVIGHQPSGEIALGQDFPRTLGNLLRGKLPLVPRGNMPMIAVDALAEFMARIIDTPDAVGQQYVLAHRQQLSLKDALHICATAAGVRAPYASLPVGFFKALGRMPLLARLLDINGEALNFIRPERLSSETLQATYAMQQQLGLTEIPLADTLVRTTHYVQAQQAATTVTATIHSTRFASKNAQQS